MDGNVFSVEYIKLRIKMKNRIILSVIVLGFVAFSCSESPFGQQPIDSIAPGPVSNVVVKNIPGGAIIKYTLPEDEDLLCVKALYTLKNGITESKSSLYNDSLKVLGFGDIEPREVSIIAVDRSRNESVPVKVTVTPEEAPVVTIGKTLSLIEDFGGVQGQWENLNRDEVTIHILRQDEYEDYQPLETFYTTVVKGKGATRGLDTIPANFGIYAMDRWGNVSPTVYKKLTPLYETSFDKSKWRDAKLINDIGEGVGWGMGRIWDNVYGKGHDNGFSSPGGTGVWPQSITIDLGVVGKISRVQLFQRGDAYIFGEGNLKLFEVYGSPTYDATGNWDSWTLLGTFESIKPSGLPLGQHSTEDDNIALYAGEDFIMPLGIPAVRWIRIKVIKTWAGGDNFQIGELFVFGDNRPGLYD